MKENDLHSEEPPPDEQLYDLLKSAGDFTREPRQDPESRQFSVGRLLVLVTVCAVIGSGARMLNLPASAQAVFTFCWMALAAYVVLRLPNILYGQSRRSKRWKKLKTDRAELEAMVARNREMAEAERRNRS